MTKLYNYIIVGAGLYGSVLAWFLTKAGHSCLVLERRNHIGGNCATEKVKDINIHKYGPHVFHTDNVDIWKSLKKWTTIQQFHCAPKLKYKGYIFSIPINLMTLNQLWRIDTPEMAKKIIDEKTAEYKLIYPNPQNAEEWALTNVGLELYEIFYKGYLIKQWQRDPKDIPAFILQRQKARFNYNDSYYDHKHVGIPDYDLLFKTLLAEADVKLNTDYLKEKDYYNTIGKTIIYSGPIDAYYDYKYGELEYKSIDFKQEILEGVKDYQGTFMMSYSNVNYPFTRIIEHKHFEYGQQPDTVITREYPKVWKKGIEPFYPVNDDKNQKIFNKYATIKNNKVIFGGRLGTYRYLDMDETIQLAVNKYYEIKNLL